MRGVLSLIPRGEGVPVGIRATPLRSPHPQSPAEASAAAMKRLFFLTALCLALGSGLKR